MKRYKRCLEEGDEAISKRTAQRYGIYKSNLQDEEEEIANNSSNSEHETSMNITNGSNISEQDISLHGNISIENYSKDESIKLFEKPVVEDTYRSFYNPDSLQDFMKSDCFFERITTAVDKTRGELFLMVLKYAVTNYLSITAMTNLFKLVNTIFEAPILPESSYITDKLLNPKDGVEFHAVCHNCSAYLGEFGRIESTKMCSVCNIDIDLSNESNTSFFVLINPSKQISDLLHIYENHYDYVVNNRPHKKGYIEDVYDGKLYRKFVKSLSDDRSNYVTAVFNTDGAEKFKCSKYSIWPLFLKINEIPKEDRNNKLITCGLWFNKKKPDMSVFLDKLVDLINPLSNEGVMCNIKGEQRLVKLHILSCCVDSVARAPIQGIKQFNGNFGCNWCLHPGQYAEGSMKYPIENDLPEPRDHHKTIATMLQINTHAPSFGIKYPSPLINLSSFNIIQGFTPDYLHCCLEGVASQLTNYYLQSMSDDEIKELDVQMNNIAAPNQIGRLCRPLSSRNDWKAREYENFTLYYSIPILSSILPSNKFDHWLLFVESLYILLKDSININELNHADFMLHKFVLETQEIFGIKAMTFNVHQMLHISESVLNWGPLWTNSTFSFESANHYILRAIKCSRGVTHQIVRYVNINHNMLILEEYVKHKLSELVVMYCNDVLTGKVKNICKISQTVYFGKGDDVEDTILNNLQLSEQSTKLFFKMVKAHCLYESHIKSKRRSNNSFALLNDGTFIRIVGFIVDDSSKQEFTVCNILNTIKYSQQLHPMFKKVTNIDQTETIVKTKKIDRVCIFMNIYNTMYVCPVPNLIHY